MRQSWAAFVLRALRRLVFGLVVLFTAIWVGFAFHFQLPFGDVGRAVAIIVWGLFALAAFWYGTLGRGWRWRIGYALALVVVGLWWSTILPRGDRDWAADVARMATGTIDGDQVTIANVRNFAWRSETDFTPVWEKRTYDLRDLRTVDLILAYWSGPAIAHTIVTFGFSDGSHLAFSGEIRREEGESFSALGGFFKEFELVLIAADERDIVHLRTNIRGEDVYLYPLRMDQTAMRELFLSYVELGNELEARPAFYNTITANCTTVVFRLVRALDPGLPLDYRVLLSGFLPGYIYDRQPPEPPVSFEEFRRRAAISALGKAAGDSADFSAAIRAGLPPG